MYEFNLLHHFFLDIFKFVYNIPKLLQTIASLYPNKFCQRDDKFKQNYTIHEKTRHKRSWTHMTSKFFLLSLLVHFYIKSKLKNSPYIKIIKLQHKTYKKKVEYCIKYSTTPLCTLFRDRFFGHGAL